MAQAKGPNVCHSDLLVVRIAAVSSSSMVDNDEDIDTNYLTDGDTPVTDMGGQGTGDPWWIWIIVGVLIFALCACLGKFKAIFSFSLR